MTEQEILLIDDETDSSWRLVTDNVMGGISRGQLIRENVDDQPCLKMTGDVSLDNNGGFIQAVIDVPGQIRNHINSFKGVTLRIAGNSQQYNIHLRTSDLMLPWQSYRHTFVATPDWHTLYLPFDIFSPYRTDTVLDINRLNRIGIVAIGREFTADICFTGLGLYR